MEEAQSFGAVQQVNTAIEKRRKVQVLVLLGVAVVVLLVLAASLPQLELHAGHPFSLGGTEEVAIGEGNGLQSGGRNTGGQG